jgi:hypothetical protein
MEGLASTSARDEVVPNLYPRPRTRKAPASRPSSDHPHINKPYYCYVRKIFVGRCVAEHTDHEERDLRCPLGDGSEAVHEVPV